MTKIDFYSGVDDKLRTACKLSHKAMQNGLRVLLHTPDEATTGALDELLWHYPATAFMPHCRSHEASAAEMPVVVGHDSNSISKVKQGGDERATKTVHLARLGASEEANAVSPMKWNWNDSESFPHSQVLISLHTTCLPFFSRFERVIEIVSRDAEDARLGRERFGFYRDRGYEIRHFNLTGMT